MNISWYLGFGWRIIILMAVLGAASWYYAEGWLYWLLYVLFALLAAFSLTRFRLYKREPWRRIHHRSLDILKRLIVRQPNTPGVRDKVNLCRELAQALMADDAKFILDDSSLLTAAGRKAYFRQLVEDYPLVFVQNLPPENREQAQGSILKDIDSSEFGPDIVIAAVIEKTYGRLEAARYLLAMASGYAK